MKTGSHSTIFSPAYNTTGQAGPHSAVYRTYRALHSTNVVAKSNTVSPCYFDNFLTERLAVLEMLAEAIVENNRDMTYENGLGLHVAFLDVKSLVEKAVAQLKEAQGTSLILQGDDPILVD